MTNKEKAALLKDTISQLYEKEGRSYSYISRLLKIDRKALTNFIKEQKMEKANCSYLTPSNQKFANKNKDFIIACYTKGYTDKDIAKQLNVTVDYFRNIAKKTPQIQKVRQIYLDSVGEKIRETRQERNTYYHFEEIEGEEWKEIKGYPDYFISNCGRVKHYLKRYKCYRLLTPSENQLSKRYHVAIGQKRLQLARLVAHTFVDGYSKTNNTVDHINNNFQDNRACNLQWVSQLENNKRSYRKDNRVKNVKYSRNSHFKEIILNGKYHFKTIIALGKFLGVSETQTHRYISGETPFNGKITFVY
jgi:hypothetical protein